MLLGPEDIEPLQNGKAVQKITTYNPSHGMIGDLIEAGVGKIGVLTNTDIGAKDLVKIVKQSPSLLNGLIAHSHGTIKTVQMLKELNKTEEGRKLIKENVKKLVFAGPAIGPKDLEEIEVIVGKEKVNVLINKGDILNCVTRNKVTTEGDDGHSGDRYNFNFVKKEGEDKYSRPSELRTEKEENGKNIHGEIKNLNGEDVRTLLQKLKDAIFKKKKGD